MVSSRHWVALALTSGMPVFEASVPCEVFGIDRPDLVSPWYRFSIVGLGDGPVRIGPGFLFPATDDCDALAHADTVIVPACADVHDDPPEQLVAAVRAAHAWSPSVLARSYSLRRGSWTAAGRPPTGSTLLSSPAATRQYTSIPAFFTL